MQVNHLLLSKKAIDAALKKDWEKAVELNELILAKNPEDKEAKTRLGRAYLKTEKFLKAKKIFKDILKDDPINQIALRNYELASEQKSIRDDNCESMEPTRVLIKEPGTSTQTKVRLLRKLNRIYEPGEILSLRVHKNSTIVMDNDTKKDLGEIEGELAKTIFNARKEEREVIATYLKSDNDFMSILLKCKYPIFRSEKQQEKPYMKGVIDENEMEVVETEEIPEE